MRLGLQGDDIRQLSEAPGFQFPGELRDDVEAAGLRGSVESAGERGLDLFFAGSRGGRIAPRLPHAGYWSVLNTRDAPRLVTVALGVASLWPCNARS